MSPPKGPLRLATAMRSLQCQPHTVNDCTQFTVKLPVERHEQRAHRSYYIVRHIAVPYSYMPCRLLTYAYIAFYSTRLRKAPIIMLCRLTHYV